MLVDMSVVSVMAAYSDLLCMCLHTRTTGEPKHVGGDFILLMCF